jgi:hypothetical protein
MDNIQEEEEEEYDYNNFPAISFIRIGIGLTQQIFQEQEEEQELEEKQEPKEPIETMTYYKKMHKLYHELKNRK